MEAARGVGNNREELRIGAASWRDRLAKVGYYLCASAFNPEFGDRSADSVIGVGMVEGYFVAKAP